NSSAFLFNEKDKKENVKTNNKKTRKLHGRDRSRNIHWSINRINSTTTTKKPSFLCCSTNNNSIILRNSKLNPRSSRRITKIRNSSSNSWNNSNSNNWNNNNTNILRIHRNKKYNTKQYTSNNTINNILNNNH